MCDRRVFEKFLICFEAFVSMSFLAPDASLDLLRDHRTP